MNCRSCQAWLQCSLDGEGENAPPGWERHLRWCSDCAAQAAAGGRLAEALSQLEPPAPPPGLARAITAEVLSDFRGRRARRVRRGAAVAAAVLLVLALRALQVPRPDTASPTPFLVRSQPEAPAPTPLTLPGQNRSAPAVPLRDAVGEAGSAVVSLTSRTADEAVGHTRLLLPVVSSPTLPDLNLPAPLEPAVGPLREASQGVSAGLEPVATSARRAVDLFLRDLPPMDGDTRPGL
jgi:hypothetical protein